MKKSIYHHINEAYKDDVPTLEQVTAIIKEHAPSIYSPNQTFDEIVSDIHNNYAWYFKNTERN
jgi:hypothetical protein